MTDLTNLNTLSQADLAKLTATQIQQLTPAQLKALDTTHCAWLTTKQIAALTAPQIAAMSPQQVAALASPGSLSVTAASALTAAQTTAFTFSMTWTDANWFNALSPDALAAIPPSVIKSLYNAASQLTAATVSHLTPAQVASMGYLYLLSADGLSGITPAQACVVDKSIWYFLGADKLTALTPAAIAAITPDAIGYVSYFQAASFKPDTIAVLTTAQVAALSCTESLSTAAVAALSPAQVAAIPAGAWGKVSATWLAALSPAAFSAIPAVDVARWSSDAVSHLSVQTVSAMSAQQIAAMSNLSSLSSDAVASLRPDQLSALPPTIFSKLPATWINQLTPAAFAGIQPAAFGSLTAQAVGSLRADFISSMTAAQLAGLSNPQWIPIAQAAMLRPEQLRLATDWDSVSASWLNALSADAFAAIPATGINQMSLAALQGLDSTRRAIALKSADEIHAGYIDMASKDASVNYDSVLANLQLMCANIGVGGLSTAQFNAFNNTFASARSVTGDQSYVSSLMGCMLGEGVQVNMSADAFKQSIDKWFLGTNSATASSYVDLSDSPLFVGSIQQAADGLSQGQLGDCWLISSLEDLADNSPERLNGLISANGNGTYAVKFFNSSDNSPVFVTVDGKVASYGADTGHGAWARLVEEAYVAACSSGLLQANGYSTPWANQTDELDGGVSGYALKTISGGSYKSYDSGAAAWDAVKAAFDTHSGLVSYGSSSKVSTGSDGKTNLVGGHAFSVIGIDEANHKFILRNPWSDDLTFELSPQELDAIPGSGEFTVMQTPAEYGSAYSHYAGTDWSTVSAAWINGQTAAMIGAITPQALNQLCAATVQGLSASTLQAMNVQQLASMAHLDQLSASAVGGLSAARLTAVGIPWVNGLSAAAVAALPVDWIASLSQSQCQALSGAVVGAMTSQQVAALRHPDWLSPAGASGLTAEQIPFLSTSWSYQSADWFNALSSRTIAALPLAAIQAMSGSAVSGLSAATIHAMTPQQIGAFAHPDKLSVAAFGGLTAAQVPAVAVSWYWMSAAQLNALSTGAFAAIPAAGINQMTKASLQGLDAIHRDIALRSADATHAGYIKTAPAAVTDWTQVTATGMNALSTQALAAIASADLQKLPASTVQGLNAATVAALSPQQIAALPHPEQLSAAAFGALTAVQVSAITASWGQMSGDQLNAMMPEAFGAIAAAGINQMSKEALQGLDKAHHDLALKLADAAHTAILDPKPVKPAVDWSTITASDVNALSPQALAAVSPADLQKLPAAAIQGLSAATVAALSPQQIASIPHPEQLSVAAFGALTAAQVPAISGSWGAMSAAQINAMTPQAIAALPAQGLKAIEGSAAEKGLSASTIAAMTPQQIAAMDHPDWLSASAFSGMTASQASAVSISWYWMSADQINAMSPQAIAAIPAQGIKDIEGSAAEKGLSASTIAAMSPQQIAAMDHPDWLSASAFSGMTASQVKAVSISWGWMSADQLNALPAQSFAAIPASGVNQMSKGALQGLDAAHHDLALKLANAQHAGYLAPVQAVAAGTPTSSAASLVQAMASFTVPMAVTTGAHAEQRGHAAFTLVKAR